MFVRIWIAVLILAATLTGPSLAQSTNEAMTAADMVIRGDTEKRVGHYEEALSWYRMAANRGDADAEVRIGEMYELARGVTEDMNEAMIWFRKAADQNNAQGQLSVGILYANGWGVTQDYRKALIWYRKAADQGNAIAAESIGTIYNNGLGVQPDFPRARIWYDKAIAAGDTAAIVPLCGVYSAAWTRVAFSNDMSAMDDVIGKIDPYCVDLIKAAKARRSDAKRLNP